MKTTTTIILENGKKVPVINDYEHLMKYGVCRAKLPFTEEEMREWAALLSQVTPLNFTAEADGEYAFYRNILEEPNFPFDRILSEETSHIAQILQRHFFDASDHKKENLQDVVRLDDAFCIHYNTSQEDTRCAKHTDPSDITVNMCLECSEGMEGSQVLFYGTERIYVARGEEIASAVDVVDEKKDCTEERVPLFAVGQVPGYATVHWGKHPHQTAPLLRGTRTNIVLTYCYKEDEKSGAIMRTCYATDSV